MREIDSFNDESIIIFLAKGVRKKAINAAYFSARESIHKNSFFLIIVIFKHLIITTTFNLIYCT